MKPPLYHCIIDGRRFNSLEATTEHLKLSRAALTVAISRSKDKDLKTFTIKVKGINIIIINTVKTNGII